MPFDNAGKPVITIQDVSALLRDRSRWPQDFVWNYRNCATCAMGLIEEYFGVSIPYASHRKTYEAVAAVVDISPENANRVFIHAGGATQDMGTILPEDVADVIDKIVAKQVEHIMP